MEQRLLGLFKKEHVLRIKDLAKYGIHPEVMSRLCKKGLVERTSRGLYVERYVDATENHGIVQAAKAVPRGIICLLTALRFHDIGTQAPFEVWMAIDRRQMCPRISYPPLRIVRFSGKALKEGVEGHIIEGVRVQMYCAAKTVADCFKYRNKIGLDVALEALHDVIDRKKCTADELWKYAQICRVANVMNPYLEALL